MRGKRAVKQVQALGIDVLALPGELNTHVTQEGTSWGSLAATGETPNPKSVLVPGMERG